MDIQISMWGNSLAVRLPKALSKQLGLTKGSKMRAEVKRGKLVLSPADDKVFGRFLAMGKEFNLDKMVKRITKKNMNHDYEWLNAVPVGKEVW